MAGVEVQTTLGTVRGTAKAGVHVFKGIPYAAAPVGELRFRPPAARKPWSGVLDATSYGPSCPQPFGAGTAPPLLLKIFHTWGMNRTEELQDEDCLVLNVWTPSEPGSRPVMVRIHGGGFTMGSGSWAWHDGSNLARRGDVVVVTLNHRLGVLGFLQLDDLAGRDYDGSGNASMLDLVAALEWVRDNISEFGGDPENVTIFGESGGGFKVSTLLAMPPARGLFRQAIVQSGPGLTALEPAAATENAKVLLEELGVSAIETRVLGEIPVHDILRAQQRVAARQGGGMAAAGGWSPVLHPEFLPIAPGTHWARALPLRSRSWWGRCGTRQRCSCRMKAWRRASSRAWTTTKHCWPA
jgi:para-nitrobenzyl esterase